MAVRDGNSSIRSVWNTENFLQDIYEGILRRTGKGRPYDGVVFYGVNDLKLLNFLRDDLEIRFKNSDLECYVFAFFNCPKYMAIHNKADLNGGEYHLIDVGWFVERNILKKVIHTHDRAT